MAVESPRTLGASEGLDGLWSIEGLLTTLEAEILAMYICGL